MMCNDVAISVKNVSKRFKLYDDPILGPIKELALFWRKDSLYKTFWAVKNVSFDIRREEVVGIIGPNGAGKTTLLKMIAGLLRVDKGSIVVNGNITALLVMGLGFNPEFTGRENILYGGMLLGMSKKEVLSKMNSIIDFAELRKFIDQPFRTYSAGMQARLTFATSLALDPEILIVDEALATGDAYFIIKCMERIHEICSRGTTILYVSHNIHSVKRICNRALRLDKGKIIADGDANEICDSYLDDLLHDVQIRRTYTPDRLSGLEKHGAIGTLDVVLEKLEIESASNGVIKTGEAMTIVMTIQVKRFIDTFYFTLLLVRLQDRSMACALTNNFFFKPDNPEGVSMPAKMKPGSHRLEVEVPAVWLNTGTYRIDLYLYDKEYVASEIECLYYKRNVINFDVQLVRKPQADYALYMPFLFKIKKI